MEESESELNNRSRLFSHCSCVTSQEMWTATTTTKLWTRTFLKKAPETVSFSCATHSNCC